MALLHNKNLPTIKYSPYLERPEGLPRKTLSYCSNLRDGAHYVICLTKDRPKRRSFVLATTHHAADA